MIQRILRTIGQNVNVKKYFKHRGRRSWLTDTSCDL